MGGGWGGRGGKGVGGEVNVRGAGVRSGTGEGGGEDGDGDGAAGSGETRGGSGLVGEAVRYLRPEAISLVVRRRGGWGEQTETPRVSDLLLETAVGRDGLGLGGWATPILGGRRRRRRAAEGRDEGGTGRCGTAGRLALVGGRHHARRRRVEGSGIDDIRVAAKPEEEERRAPEVR